MSVADFPIKQPLSDVPAYLRRLADEIENGDDGIKACIVLLDWCGNKYDFGVEARCYGPDGDPVRAVGLMTIAAADLMQRINNELISRRVAGT